MFPCLLQQYRLSIMDLQVEERDAQIQRAMVQELASWQADGSIDSLEVTLASVLLCSLHRSGHRATPHFCCAL